MPTGNSGRISAPDEAVNASLQRWARLTGFLYLFILAAYDLGDWLAVSPAIVPGDFAATARNIAANETFYRLGLAGEFVASWLTVLLGAGLYAITEPVNRLLALTAFAFRIVEAALGGVCAVLSFVALRVYTGTGFDAHTAAALTELLSRAYGACFTVTVIFFSAGSIVFFALLFKARFIPRLLSGFGMLASALVTVLGFVNLIAPKLAPLLAPGWMPILAAEVLTGLWLLVRGVNTRHWTLRA